MSLQGSLPHEVMADADTSGRVREVCIYGASGHAKVIIDALRQSGACVRSVYDDDPAKVGGTISGCEILYAEALAASSHRAPIVVAIGNNSARERIARRLEGIGSVFASALHPRACIAGDVCIGDGSAVLAGAVVNSAVQIGRHAIINTCASVDHDCVVGDFAHVAPGVRLCGGVRIGEGALLGVGSVVLPGIRVGAGAIVGAGSVVLRDVPEHVTVVGNPARISE